MPLVHGAQAAPSPAFPPAPPPRTSPLASPASQRFKSSRGASSSSRKGPALLALFMAMMVLAGTAWFFRDQLRVAWTTHMMADEAESDALEFHPTPAEPEAAENFDPTQPPKPSKTGSPSVVEAPPAPAPANGTGSAPTPPPAGATTTGNPDSSPPEQVQRPAMAATPDAAPAPAPAPGSAPVPAPAVPNTQVPKAAPNLVEVPSPMPPTPEPPPATGAASPKAVPAPAPAPMIVDVPEDSRPALEALQQFLAASRWEERLRVVQGADLMRPLMQSYYASMPDGPLAVTKIALIRHDKAPQTGPPHCVFQIGGGEVKRPLPIMVEQSPDGWKVDWLTFTEFKDNLLARFMESHQEGPKRFHVLVRRTHYFDDNVPEMDKKICVEVQSPTPPFVGSVFAKRGTPVANILDRYLGWEVDQAAAVVELEWRREGDQQWVELTGLPQFNWRNAMAGEVIPPPQAAPTAPVAVPARD
ncbi:MAG TPA: hypothetical protein VLE43_17055 [Candidatus Saccharimonadia bacterium]|nr:hypothetical protein [Candidatus Saccharimonadia bacterium]